MVLYPASIGNMGRIGAFHCCDVALVRQRGHSCVGVAHCAAVCCILPPFFSGGSIRPPLKKGVSIQHCVMAAAILLEDRVEVVMHMLFDTENGDIFLHEHPFSRAPTTTYMPNPCPIDLLGASKRPGHAANTVTMSARLKNNN